MSELDVLVNRAPERYRKHYRSVLTGKASRLMAIKMKCLECCAWERTENGVDKIGDCSVRSCPLWAFRPFQAVPLKAKKVVTRRPGSKPPFGRPANSEGIA